MHHAEAVMGTVVSFVVHPGATGPAGAQQGLRAACEVLHRDDSTFSTWKPDSPVSRLRRGDLTPSDAPPEVDEVLRLCRLAVSATGGWFDPWAMPGGVDPTGLVKGWSAQRALRALMAAGVDSAMVNAGGDIACSGCPPHQASWRVGIRHPWQPAAFAAVIEPDAAVATSGTYERPGQLIDPRSGEVALETVSATVTGADLAMADALATGLAVGGAEVLDLIEQLDGYQAYRIDRDGGESTTSGMRFAQA